MTVAVYNQLSQDTERQLRKLDQLANDCNQSYAQSFASWLHDFSRMEESDMDEDIPSIITFLKSGIGGAIVIYNQSNYIFNSGRRSLKTDMIVIKREDYTLRFLGYNCGDATRTFCTRNLAIDSAKVSNILDQVNLLDFLTAIFECVSVEGTFELSGDFSDSEDWSWVGLYANTEHILFNENNTDCDVFGSWNRVYEIPSQAITQETQPKKVAKMSAKATTTALIAKNKDAAITAAKITAGKVAMKQVSKLVTPKLPMMLRGYADTPVGRLAIANVFGFAIAQYMPGNEKAGIVADAMLQGAMMEMADSFNFEEMLSGVLDKVDISKLQKLTSEEE